MPFTSSRGGEQARSLQIDIIFELSIFKNQQVVIYSQFQNLICCDNALEFCVSYCDLILPLCSSFVVSRLVLFCCFEVRALADQRLKSVLVIEAALDDSLCRFTLHRLNQVP